MNGFFSLVLFALNTFSLSAQCIPPSHLYYVLFKVEHVWELWVKTSQHEEKERQ